MSEEIKAVSYCVGMSIAGSLMQQDLEGIDADVMAQAIRDVFEGKELNYQPEQANDIIQEYLAKSSMVKFEAIKKEGEDFLEKNAGKEGVHTTASGLQYEVMNEGNGPKPG
jgi:FKBP-type peptidyl-prolyl cis-trans isomerase FklB